MRQLVFMHLFVLTLIARFMGPKWGPSEADKTPGGGGGGGGAHESCYLGGLSSSQ